jgi:hypothetical protein
LTNPDAEAPTATYIPQLDSPTPPPGQEPPPNQEPQQTASVEKILALALILTAICAFLGLLIYLVKTRNNNEEIPKPLK